MATLVGSAQAFSNTVTVPAHSVGDFLFICALTSSGSVPVVPAGWTALGSSITQGSAKAAAGYKIATATNDTSGTWANASIMTCSVYTPAATKSLLLGTTGSASATSSTASYPVLSLFDQTGLSWVVAAAVQTNGNATGAAPTGMTNRQVANFFGTLCNSIHDTNGAVASWAGGSTALGGSRDWIIFEHEIREIPASISGAWDRALTYGGTWSSGDRVFTRTNGTASFSTDSQASGKHYAEVTITSLSTAASYGVGMLAGSTYVYLTGSGLVKNEAGTTLGTIFGYSTGDVIGIALDQTNSKIWFRKNGGFWNSASVGGNDPTTNVGGYATGSGTFYVFTLLPDITNAARLQTGPYFSTAAPSGFSDWHTNSGDIAVSVTGSSATASVGTVTPRGKANVAVTGNVATFFPGSVTIRFSTDVAVSVTGNSMTASVGTPSETTNSRLSVTGNAMTASVGTVSQNYAYKVSVTGNAVTVSKGNVVAGVVTAVSVTGNAVTASVGDVSVIANHKVNVTGNSMTASVGDPFIRIGYRPLGEQVTVSVGTVEVINWQEIPNVSSTWASVVTTD